MKFIENMTGSDDSDSKKQHFNRKQGKFWRPISHENKRVHLLDSVVD